MVNIRQLSETLDGAMSVDKLKHDVDSIKEEFDDHLNAINSNTLEIQDNYERISQLDNKIDAIASKLENTHMMLTELMKRKNKFSKTKLSDEEQKVFIGIYSENRSMSLTTLSRRLGLNRSTIRSAINSMKKKEVPLLVDKEGADTRVGLEQRFKEIQATENLIKIDEKNRKNVYVRDLRYFF
ncbi:MAG: hypothetical protein ACLFTR_04410 [Candidatus Woesearchaeota archaeon]